MKSVAEIRAAKGINMKWFPVGKAQLAAIIALASRVVSAPRRELPRFRAAAGQDPLVQAAQPRARVGAQLVRQA